MDGVSFRFWVKDLKHTWYGDANLDGEFNRGDLVQVGGRQMQIDAKSAQFDVAGLGQL